MSENDRFIRQIESDPKNDMLRLVYADWLDEYGDPNAAEYLRTELELAKVPINSPKAPGLRGKLWQAWAAVDPKWLLTFTQPRMLRANPTPFETTWVNFGLGSLRVRGGTYKHWAYDSIPDLLISEIRGEFQYMIPNSEVASRRDYMESHRQNFEQMLREAREQGIRLPSDFVRLMQDLPRLENSPRSPTDCGFAFPDEYKSIRASPSGEGMHIHFYCDSQSCVLWDLYIHPMGGHCVIARDSDYFDPMPPEPLEPVRDGPRAWFVAPSFEAFVYRIWLENQIWYLEHSDSYQKMAGISAQAAPAIHAYVNHYRQQSSRDK